MSFWQFAYMAVACWIAADIAVAPSPAATKRWQNVTISALAGFLWPLFFVLVIASIAWPDKSESKS